ncbi:NfeD family protein [Aureimonas leprariae]|uniref:NfeD family protein n=1 Tax=Plantimonas leprariae TaxID=2615207 RepID=A0A7V7PPI0_9HYPH|nr:NfeD family protein [Aureimonas leprariae]KAB0679847.1 NfeD family protein [Aureimonas leprariae]
MSEVIATYGWWILGLLLLGLEVVLPGVYLLFFGIAALVVGANGFLVPGLSWQSEVVGFVVVSVVAVLLGHRWYGQKRVSGESDGLNRRTARLIGRRATLTDAIEHGQGRVKIEDGWWRVEGPDLPVGAQVVIESADGSLLRVRPVAPSGD